MGKTRGRKEIDRISFELGMINCFVEMVACGVKKLAIIAGNVSSDEAKIKGIIPAILTISGRVPLTGIDIRLPTRRPGYITGTLRRPC